MNWAFLLSIFASTEKSSDIWIIPWTEIYTQISETFPKFMFLSQSFHLIPLKASQSAFSTFYNEGIPMFIAQLIKMDLNKNFNSLSNNKTMTHLYLILHNRKFTYCHSSLKYFSSQLRFSKDVHTPELIIAALKFPEKTSNSILCHKQWKKLSLNVYSAPPCILWCQRDEMKCVSEHCKTL